MPKPCRDSWVLNQVQDDDDLFFSIKLYAPVTPNLIWGPWIHIHAVPDAWVLNHVQGDGDVRARHLTVLREPVENLIKRSVSAAQG